LVNLPGAPPQTKYPIGYPAFLSLLWRLRPDFPANVIFLKYATLACAALAAGFVFLYLRRFGYADRSLATGSSLLSVTSPGVVFYNSLLISEALFSVLLVSFLWTIEWTAAAPASNGRRPFFLAGLLAGAAFQFRLAGFMLVLAGGFVLWRRARPIGLYLFGSGLMVIPWCVWLVANNHSHVDPALAYHTDYIGWWLDYGLPGFASVISQNFMQLLKQLTFLPTVGFWQILREVLPFLGSFLLSMAIGGASLWIMIREAWCGKVLPVALLSCLAIQLVWPWPLIRFLIPMLPFIALYMLIMLGKTLRFIQRRPLHPIVAAGSVALVVGLNLSVDWTTSRCVQASGYPTMFPAQNLPDWDSYRKMFAWVGDHAPKTAILASNLDTMAYLYTNRTTFRPFVTNPLRLFYGKEGPPIGTAAEMFDRLHYFGVNYLLCMPMPGFAENWPFAAVISALESANAGTLRLVYAGTDPRFKIYALDWNKSATDTSQNKTASAPGPQSGSPRQRAPMC